MCDDRWHFAVGTHDGATTRLYVDGVMEAAATVAFVLNPNATTPLNIGAYVGRRGATAATDPHYGRVDEAFVTNDVLSDDQIRALYCAKIPHGFSDNKTVVNLAVRRAIKCGPFASADFPTPPLRLHNFTGGSLNDQGSGNVPLVNNGAAVSVVGADGANGGAYNFVTASSQSLERHRCGLAERHTATRSYGCWFQDNATGSGIQLFFDWGSLNTTRVALYMNAGAVQCGDPGGTIAGPYAAGSGQWHHAIACRGQRGGRWRQTQVICGWTTGGWLDRARINHSGWSQPLPPRRGH